MEKVKRVKNSLKHNVEEENKQETKQENVTSVRQRINVEEIFKDIDVESYVVDVKREYKKNVEIVKKKLKLSEDQLKSAITILKGQVENKFKNNKNLALRKEDEFFYLNFVFSKLPVSYSIKPVPIKIPSSLYGDNFASKVCIFVKDPKSDFKDLELTFPFNCKVMSIEKLKLKYERFNQRRDLVKSYDLFLCDSKVYLILKRLLGKPFYESKKYPVPITMDYSDKEGLLNKILSVVDKKTIFYMNSGPNYSVKLARATMEDEDIVRNAAFTARRVLPHILKWGIDFKE